MIVSPFQCRTSNKVPPPWVAVIAAVFITALLILLGHLFP